MSETINETPSLSPRELEQRRLSAVNVRAGAYLTRMATPDELLVAQRLIQAANERGMTVTLDMLGIRLPQPDMAVPPQAPLA